MVNEARNGQFTGFVNVPRHSNSVAEQVQKFSSSFVLTGELLDRIFAPSMIFNQALTRNERCCSMSSSRVASGESRPNCGKQSKNDHGGALSGPRNEA